MVGHMLDIIMSLMQDRLQDEMCLSREENFNSSNTFLSQYVKANPLSTSEIGAAGLCTGTCAHTVHTNELPNCSLLCAQCEGV